MVPWTAVQHASLSITNSRSLLKLMSIKSVVPSNHFILCYPLLLPLSIFPSIRVFSNGSVLLIRWPKYWSFSFSINPSNEYSGLISLGLTGSPCCPRDSQESCSTPLFKSIISLVLSFLYSPTLVSIHEYWKKNSIFTSIISFLWWTFVCKLISRLFNMLSRLVIAFLPRTKCWSKCCRW